MHAELTHKRALIADRARSRRFRAVTIHAGPAGDTRQCRIELLVDNVGTEVGPAVEVELSAGTDVPHTEVVATAGSCKSCNCQAHSGGLTGTPHASEHVRVRLEGELGLPARAFDHAGEASRTKRRPPFRGEHEGRLGVLLALQPPQGPQFVS